MVGDLLKGEPFDSLPIVVRHQMEQCLLNWDHAASWMKDIADSFIAYVEQAKRDGFKEGCEWTRKSRGSKGENV